MFCSNCGEKIEGDSKFCVKCGKVVEYGKIVHKKSEPKGNIIVCCMILVIAIIVIFSVIFWTKQIPVYNSTARNTSRDYTVSTAGKDKPIYKRYNDSVDKDSGQLEDSTASIEDRYRLEDFLYTTYDESELYMFGKLLSATEDTILGGYSYNFEYGSIGVDANQQIVSIVANADIEGTAMIMNVFIDMSIDDIFLNLGRNYETEEVDEYGNKAYGYYSDDGTFFVKFYIDENGRTIKVLLFDPYL